MYVYVCKSSNGVLFKFDWKYYCVFNWDGGLNDLVLYGFFFGFVFLLGIIIVFFIISIILGWQEAYVSLLLVIG